MVNLMYITNKPNVAKIAEKNGVDRIWVDLETKGKKERQGQGTWITDHTIEDVYKVKESLNQAKLVVRINPWNEDSIREIDEIITAGADIIMLPMWRNAGEVKSFLDVVDGRTKTILLLETKEASYCIDDVISLNLDEVHIGLRDLSLSFGIESIFELYKTKILDDITEKLRNNSIKFGIGGIGKFGIGLIPGPETILLENLRMGSSSVILSRTFCNSDNEDIKQIENSFMYGVRELTKWYNYAKEMPEEVFKYNHKQLVNSI